MDNNSVSCSNGDYGNVENECEISEPCNYFEGDYGPPMKKLKRLNRELDKKIGRELMTQMVINHDLPFNFVEWDGFRAFSNYVSFNEAHCVSKNVVAADVMKVYFLEKEKLKKQLAEINGSVCLSCRCWTSSASSRGYIILAVHFMDENWKLNVKLLNFCHLDPPHDDSALSKKVFECMQEWGIERKVCSITVDNASSNGELQNLKKQLCSMDSLLSNGDYFHFRCCASVLDHMVQESLKVISSLVHKIRKSVKYVGESNSRMQQFYQCVEEVGGVDGGDGLHLDVSAKWNSTYLMLKSAIKYRRAFEHMHLRDMTYRQCPSSEEWVRGEKICGFLGIFYELISESTYPMLDTHLHVFWKIELSLKEMKLSVDDNIRDMASKMLDEFDQYLSEYSMILAFGVVLNPSLKFECLEYIYERAVSDTNIVKEKVNNVRKALNALLNEYVKKGAPTSSRVSTSTDKSKRNSITSTYLDFLKYLEEKRQKKYAAGFTQLDLYLEARHGDDVNAFDYWKGQSKIYGDLARLARDVLSIPIIAVASESPFSAGGCILNKYRSCIISDNLQALVCSRNWLFGFPSRDQSGDVIDATRKIGINPCQQDSHFIVSNKNKTED